MPRKVGLELMANTRDRTFLMFSLSLSFFTSCFSTDNNPGNSLPPPRPSLQGIIALRCCSQLTHAHERVDTDTRSLSIRLSSLFLSLRAHTREWMQVKLYLRPNTAPRPCAHLQTRVEASRHCATVYLERRQYFVRANEWPCRWLDGGGCALGISGNKGQTGSVDCRGCVHTLPRITGRTRHRGINIHFGEMRAPDDVR